MIIFLILEVLINYSTIINRNFNVDKFNQAYSQSVILQARGMEVDDGEQGVGVGRAGVRYSTALQRNLLHDRNS